MFTAAPKQNTDGTLPRRINMESIELPDLENIFNRNIIVAGFLAVMILLTIIILVVAVNRNRNYSQTSTSANDPSQESSGDYGNVNFPRELKEYNYQYNKVNEGGN